MVYFNLAESSGHRRNTRTIAAKLPIRPKKPFNWTITKTSMQLRNILKQMTIENTNITSPPQTFEQLLSWFLDAPLENT